MGDVDVHAPPSGVDPEQEGQGGASFGARCCLVVIIVILFVIVVLPVLIWTLGIIYGSR